ncbi:MAG: SurA N-terminal domain-containing protein, partial [Acidobacteriota bacterium]
MHKISQRLTIISIATLIATLAFITLACKRDTVVGPSSNSGEIAARVGSVDIPLAKVDRLIEQGLGQGSKKLSDLNPVELAAARLQAIDTLITEEVLFQRARQEKIQISDEDVRNQIQRGIQSSGLSEDDFQKQLKTVGLSEVEFREEQRRKIAIEKLQEKMSPVKPPTDREISDYYNNNPGQFRIGRGVHLSAIIVDPSDNKAKNDAIGEEQAKQ